MNKKFEVGELALYQNLHDGSAVYNGTLCTVIGFVPAVMWRDKVSGAEGVADCYRVEDDEGTWLVFPSELRKLPPREDTGSLTELESICGYRPPQRAHA